VGVGGFTLDLATLDGRGVATAPVRVTWP
jgi:hypothetical protein